MEPLPKPVYGDINRNPLQDLDVLKGLLQGSQSTEEKAKTLLQLQSSNISLRLESDDEVEDDEDDDSSLDLDPWDESTAHEIERNRRRAERARVAQDAARLRPLVEVNGYSQTRLDEGSIDPLSLRARPTWARLRVQDQLRPGMTPQPSMALEIEPPDHGGRSYWEQEAPSIPERRYHGRQQGIEHMPSVGSPQENFPIDARLDKKGGRNPWRSCVKLLVRGIKAVGSCLWTTTQFIGGSCARLIETTTEKSQGQADKTRENLNGSSPRTTVMSQATTVERPRRALASTSRPESAKPEPVRENRFEMSLKKALFEETLHISTIILEPGWNVTRVGFEHVPLFSGWNERMDEYELRPQGRFVAQTKKAFNDFLEKVELGGELQVLGSGGGLSTTGVPALLKRFFTSYEWLAMWRASEGRRIRVMRGCNDTNPSEKPLTDDHDTLQALENELLGLDKYMGGDSEYLTVITYSDDFVGAIFLFKAELSDQHQINQLNRVATIADVPRKICSILREEVKPNRYVVGRNNRKLKCYARGDLPPLQIAKISNEQDPWKCCGGGWRKALRVPNLNSEYSSGEGLLATIPHVIGLLHLQHLNLTDLHSSPALAFVTPLDVNGSCRVRRGVLLNEKPQGSSHIGGNTRITVLFPRDSVWAQEQFIWA
ncbi:hypothetical protein NW762_007674 [Fusarium torreyae]|uniref:Uncharacterized protein n=1 Tax=Fusarium torreyae TaxID=1237075 RepID=A0A9W8VGG9_9HYPO|nr:hypothetical protein NW762_007674 [Fusarium torreyae]